MTKETSYKDFEEWYTEVFGGHITEEQANDTLRVAYDYYVNNRKLIVKNSELEERIHTLEVYLEGAINYLILNGDVDNRIIDDVENILHMTFNRSSNISTDQQKYTHAIKLLKRCYDDYVYLPPLRNEIEKFLEEI